ncbi:MAG: hypothetical protein A3B31_03805 [Candidatus Komeilibacteria bacterium RIFCSPLOWO2_01_FULL_53_11]|uniref:Nudix hydrolase domain-containing protein n=1 Tax=Candidatus Komeilibacteria bacterium RIFCSPLOWO2_01_FULL_53_11 TaxID=1798552 RepID=A0A1G2BSB2_9BACT|nr:MAG: hypothetical protein A3B31_03805 [Candidatus Komeilibacteria bacterium RIFCSPLOWO2_01_FULL_53_11]
MNLDGTKCEITIASGPVIVNDEGKILLHRSPDTGKYQFTGGRLDDDFSPRANAKYRPAQDLGAEIELVAGVEPLIIQGEVGKGKRVVLIHYLARLSDRENPLRGEYKWCTLKEVRAMHAKGEMSSPNVLLATEFFLNSIRER